METKTDNLAAFRVRLATLIRDTTERHHAALVSVCLEQIFARIVENPTGRE